jgi:Flp pilus assembly protein TadD
MKARDSSQVYMAVHADVGAGYTAPTSVAIGMLVSDREGHVVRAALTEMKLSPAAKGAGSPLKFVGGVNLDPGEYTVKFAIADGVRVGTVEHPFHAALVDGGALTFSDLIVGGPVPSDRSPEPAAAYTVNFGRVHGYLEAYGPQFDTVKVKYEIALSEREPAVAGFDVAGQRIGDARMAFSGVMPVPSLPPGKYVLRAVVSEGATPLKTLSRAFEIALPMLGTTTTGDAAPTASLGELSLPVYAGTLVRSLRQEALAPAVVRPFVERLRAGMKQPISASLSAALQHAADGRIGEIQLASVDSSDPVGSYLVGLTQLEHGDLGAAVDSFRQAVRVEGDSVPGLTYMAVCYAASGHDTEAAGAWQAALIEGSDVPQIFMWLGEALLRADDPSGARSILEEAVGSWPTDARFARLQAMLHARSSEWGEAVRALERYIGGGHDDPDTLVLAMEWMYRMHAAGAVIHTRAEDLEVARGWAEAYARSNGTKLPLVMQWLDFLEREKR